MRASYLKTRTRTQHFRLRIPSDLVPVFGRAEIHRSTRTSDRPQARQIARALRARAITTFAMIRHQRALGVDPRIISSTIKALDDSLPTVRRQRQPRDNYPSLRSAIDAYLGDRVHGWTAKTHLMAAGALGLFVDILGDRRLDVLSRHDCRKFRDIVLKLPPNMRKRFKGHSIGDILTLAAPPMSSKNANKIMSSVSSFLNWAVREGLLADNPARGLGVRIRHRADSERDAFSESDLKLLFEQSPVFSGCLSPASRSTRGNMIIRDSKFWLPLIALYSGMRLEEIAQLDVRDVRQVDGTWVFDVNASENKNLKTPQSRRYVPIHPILRSIGVLEYCTAIKSGPLWPDLPRSRDGFHSSRFSKWFGRYKRHIGIVSQKRTFHSFRHTAINCLKQAGVQEALIKELVGHANGSITMARYGKRLSANHMLTIVERLQYQIDLSGLSLSSGPNPKYAGGIFKAPEQIT